jgi:hypothetical protein
MVVFLIGIAGPFLSPALSSSSSLLDPRVSVLCFTLACRIVVVCVSDSPPAMVLLPSSLVSLVSCALFPFPGGCDWTRWLGHRQIKRRRNSEDRENATKLPTTFGDKDRLTGSTPETENDLTDHSVQRREKRKMEPKRPDQKKKKQASEPPERVKPRPPVQGPGLGNITGHSMRLPRWENMKECKSQYGVRPAAHIVRSFRVISGKGATEALVASRACGILPNGLHLPRRLADTKRKGATRVLAFLSKAPISLAS